MTYSRCYQRCEPTPSVNRSSYHHLTVRLDKNKMGRIVLLLLCIYFTVPPSLASFSSLGEVEGPEDEVFKQAWGMIHTAHPRILEAVIKGMGMDKGQRDAFRQRVEARVERTIRVQNVSARCEECVVRTFNK